MKTWLTVRIEGGDIEARAYGSDEFEDSEEKEHHVSQPVDVELPRAVEDGLFKLLKDAEPQIKKALARAKARVQTAVEDAIENKTILEKAAGVAKKVLGGGTKTKAKAEHK